jgi:C-terminal processing protease CtpA/Prc
LRAKQAEQELEKQKELTEKAKQELQEQKKLTEKAKQELQEVSAQMKQEQTKQTKRAELAESKSQLFKKECNKMVSTIQDALGAYISATSAPNFIPPLPPSTTSTSSSTSSVPHSARSGNVSELISRFDTKK